MQFAEVRVSNCTNFSFSCELLTGTSMSGAGDPGAWVVSSYAATWLLSTLRYTPAVWAVTFGPGNQAINLYSSLVFLASISRLRGWKQGVKGNRYPVRALKICGGCRQNSAGGVE